MSLAHAQHNEDLCVRLHGEVGKWNDWVVTTAFYSAVKYVDSKIFPFTFDKKTYNTLNDYHLSEHGERGKHESRLKVVRLRLKVAYDAFSWLYDACKTARYNNYNTSQSLADTAVIKLRLVKSCCLPKAAVGTSESTTSSPPTSPARTPATITTH